MYFVVPWCHVLPFIFLKLTTPYFLLIIPKVTSILTDERQIKILWTCIGIQPKRLQTRQEKYEIQYISFALFRGSGGRKISTTKQRLTFVCAKLFIIYVLETLYCMKWSNFYVLALVTLQIVMTKSTKRIWSVWFNWLT